MHRCITLEKQGEQFLTQINTINNHCNLRSREWNIDKFAEFDGMLADANEAFAANSDKANRKSTFGIFNNLKIYRLMKNNSIKIKFA
jgi:hypothetical protein